MKKALLPIGKIIGIAFTTSYANAALVSQYGILDLTANGGINPNTADEWRAGD